MTMKDLEQKIVTLSDLSTFTDNPIILIILIGICAVCMLLLLLKFAFVSMRKADEKKMELFLQKHSDIE